MTGIVLKNVCKRFDTQDILKDISLSINEGEFVALTGRSGSGKSTLLYIISSLDTPSEGTIHIDGQDMLRIPSHQLHRFRNEHIGFVFQFHYLLPELSALENVLMPALKHGSSKEKTPYALQLLEGFGLANKANRLPRQLSGGEQQRVAIARALVMKPRYLFADEPTGNLDSINGDSVMNVFKTVNKEHNTTVVMVTHDPDFANMAHRQIHLVDGEIK
jgi:ABC-type lipoprotein export system ATPase subunit